MADRDARPIAVIQGASGAAIQRLFHELARQWAPTVRLAGVIEDPRVDTLSGPDEAEGGPGHLHSIRDGARYTLFQQLGPGATGCSLDPAGAVMAGEAVRQQIAQGCDLVMLSKFGKMEAESGSGLLSAFVAAVEGGIPVLTSVSPRYEESWTRFADPLFVRLPPERQAVERWWQAVRR